MKEQTVQGRQNNNMKKNGAPFSNRNKCALRVKTGELQILSSNWAGCSRVAATFLVKDQLSRIHPWWGGVGPERVSKNGSGRERESYRSIDNR